MNFKLRAIYDAAGRLIRVLLTADSVSDYAGAAYLLPTLPPTPVVLADRGYEAAWIRTALRNQGSTPCIPTRNCAKRLESYDKKTVSEAPQDR